MSDSTDFVVGILLGIAIGLLIGLIFFGLVFAPDLPLKQESGDKACQIITNNSAATADTEKHDLGSYKLVCKLPSYDHTQEILIKENNK